MDLVQQRFWAKVEKTSTCWLWRAATRRRGYGTVTIQRRCLVASRVAWEWANGAIPDGLFVLHKCDNPRCVRPDHLFLGTQADNIADKVAKGRQAKGRKQGMHTHPERRPRGEGHGCARLKAVDVLKMRSMRDGGRTLEAIADDFNVCIATVWLVVTRKTWTHV